MSETRTEQFVNSLLMRAVEQLERELAAKSAEVKRLREALLTIEQWTDFPATGKFWDEAKTKPTSYAFEFGTYGERDYMRSIAREALEAK